MSSLYLPNPCLLGILLTVSTHDGNQLVFHYPPNPNEYGYQPTPLGNQVLNTDDNAYSSSSDDDEEALSDENEDHFIEDQYYTRRRGGSNSSSTGKNNRRSNSNDDSSIDGSSRGSFSLSSSIASNNNLPTPNPNTPNTYSGKAFLDMLDEQDRKRKRKESKRKNLMKNIIMGDQPQSNATTTSTTTTTTTTTTTSTANATTSTTTVPSPLIASSNTNPELNPSTTRSSSLNLLNNNSPSTIPKESPNLGNKKEKIHRIDKLFGFDVEFVSELTTPPKKLCNTRFELSVDDMAFLGLPTHINDDGNWRISNHHHKNKKSKRDKSKKQDKKHDSDSEPQSEAENADETNTHIENQNDCPMHLFHLVFVMNPPVVEYNYRIDEMFHFIVHRLTLLLRYEQQKTNYVWEQSRLILDLKEKNKYLSINEQWFRIIEESSLANLICKTYQSISDNNIVNIEINGKLRSFQIPIKTEFSSLPPRHIQVVPGSTLSSISPFNSFGMAEQLNNDPLNNLNGNANNNNNNEDTMIQFALILLDDPEIIIKDIRAEKDSLLASFIRMIKPTESLSRLSTLSGLDLSEVKLFANHLVYWRRAKAVLPLNPRNIYIVSPIASLYNLYKDSIFFKAQFQSLPNLPQFLSSISSSSIKPRTINAIIPSKDHRDLYLEAISWCLKYGYLVQLQTFLFLKISKEIKIKVDEELEMERKKKNQKDLVSDSGNDDPDDNDDEEDNKIRSTDNTTKLEEAKQGLSSTIQKDSSSISPMLSRHEDGVGSTTQISTNDSKPLTIQFEEEEEEDIILLDPESATAIERKWISKCVENQSIEIVTIFYKLLKYMNGKHPLEMVMISEGISRQDVKKLLGALDECIVSVRHW